MTDIKVIQVQATLDGVTPRKDGGVSLRFVTQEVGKDEKVTLMEFYQAFGWLQFSDQSIHTIPKERPVREAMGKPPSKRLRDVLWVWWDSQNTDTPFETFYEQKMEMIINTVKEKLPPL